MMLHYQQPAPAGAYGPSAFWPAPPQGGYAPCPPPFGYRPPPPPPVQLSSPGDADAFSALLQLSQGGARSGERPAPPSPSHAPPALHFHAVAPPTAVCVSPVHAASLKPSHGAGKDPSASPTATRASPEHSSHSDADSGISSPKHDDHKSSEDVAPSSNASLKKNRIKRPMNSFMIFGQKHRAAIQKAHPGKDNKAISKILGDMWFALSEEERKSYADASRDLAEQHRKQHPDWKFKRNVKKAKGRARPQPNATASIARSIAVMSDGRYVPSHVDMHPHGPYARPMMYDGHYYVPQMAYPGPPMPMHAVPGAPRPIWSMNDIISAQ